ncbi:MAG: adenylate/guanylate cyclase domain-containing protein [Acidimicrobiales bacterium]
MTEELESDDPRSELADLLRLAGVPDADIRDAATAGLLPLLAIESQILGPRPYDIDEVAQRAGLSVDRIRVLWGALGLATPRSGEHIFNDTDVEQLSAVAALVDSGLADPDIVMQLTRILGSSMARIANAQAELVATRRQTQEVVVADGAEWFGDRFHDILGQIWRRHLHAAARSRLAAPLHGELATDTPPQVVGFADLVGFTALSQQLDSAALASVVDRFETVAFATIGVHGGRVVKMIGDEVMFAIDDPVAAAHCALDLSESYHEADDLSDVRVGMAYGPVIDRDGDLFGPPVNLASRITAIAYPGAVVIDDELCSLLPADEFSPRAMLPRRLKHLGMVRLHVLRTPGTRNTRAERRERRRARVVELLGDAVPDVPSE